MQEIKNKGWSVTMAGLGINLALGILYVVSGSIWLPILAHILADALQGLSIRELFRDSGESNGVADVPA